MKFDEKKNIVSVCLFESYLAKYFVEHPAIFQPLTDKIFNAVKRLIEDNAKNRMFDRHLFSVFTRLMDIDQTISDFKSLRNSNSIVAYDTFFKYFVEDIMKNLTIRIPENHSSAAKHVPRLAELCHFSIFHDYQKGIDSLYRIMRPRWLFKNSNRGVTELKEKEPADEPSNDLGILASKDTPDTLKGYFPNAHLPSRPLYSPNESSEMAKWLRKYHLPVIAGASGGISITVSYLSSIVQFSKEEYQLLGILIASSTIAMGHHSFFEVMRPLSFFTGTLEEKDCLLAFYEQTIPEFVKKLPSYQEHMKSTAGATLIEEFAFREKSSLTTL